ncbi:MAG: hypothetical protein WBF13_14070 [Candidatus Zixiibacteriota bacterium]
MRDQILEKLVQGRAGLGQITRLVFIRAIRVLAFSLISTLIVWLFWLENYAWGAFLLGAALGLLAFLALNSLRKRLNPQNPVVPDKERDLTDPKNIRPDAPVEK